MCQLVCVKSLLLPSSHSSSPGVTLPQLAELTSPWKQEFWWSGAMITTWPFPPSPSHLLQQASAQGMQDFTHWLIRPQEKNNRHMGWSAPCCLHNFGVWLWFFFLKMFIVNFPSVFICWLSCTHSPRRWIWPGRPFIPAVLLLVTAGITAGLRVWVYRFWFKQGKKNIPRLQAKNLSAT